MESPPIVITYDNAPTDTTFAELMGCGAHESYSILY